MQREAFAALGRALDAVNGDLLSGHARMVWDELAMLLVNDAFEGSAAEEPDDVMRVFSLLEGHMARLREQFGGEHRGHVGAEKDMFIRMETPLLFRGQLGKLWQAYRAVHETLTNDDAEKAAAAADTMREVLQAVDMTLIEGQVHAAWMKSAQSARKPLDKMADSGELKTLREALAPLSEEMAAMIRRFGIDPAGPVYRLRCPMALEGRGAVWLQDDEDVRNPYLGASMLTCGDLIETISDKMAEAGDGHDHE